MSTDWTTRLRRASRGAGWLSAAVLMVAPALVLGADISWKSTVASGDMGGGKFTRVGTAVLSTGEKAEFKSEGSDGAIDEKGRSTATVETVMRFTDGSSITMRQQGYRDPKTLDAAGSGEFVSGTGKYQGITGQFTYKGIMGKTESMGTYTLKK